MDVAGGERRLAAIMFTDIVGYTHLAQANESLALELLEEHRSLLRPTMLAHGGTEVKTIGDAFLVEFRSALDAVTCAVEMQRVLSERNAETSPSRKIELRIGVHVGDVVHESGDVYGDAVNLASRIEPLAQPGGVCISQQVFDQIRNKTDLRIEKVGDVRLKNVDLPQGVYKIILNGKEGHHAEGHNERDRVCVLPFVNISPDPNDEYFADGLTEELITKLSEIKGLKVIARTSVMSYKRKEKKISEIGVELGVGSIIEGSVRKAGNKVRISVQLVDATTEEHLWSSNYDSTLDDIFTIQSDVASRVASALSTGIFSGVQHKETKDVEAYTLYLRANQLLNDMGESSAREAVSLLERAISRDPKFARAYASLTNAYHGLAVMGFADFSVTTGKAEEAARTALKLDPGLAEAHSAMAGVHFMMDRFDESWVEIREALRINPNLAEAYMFLAILNSISRTAEEALTAARRSYELDPVSAGAAEMVISMASWSGHESLAKEVLRRLLEVHSKNPKVYLGAADYYMERREFDEAQRMVDVARGLDPSDWQLQLSQALIFALTGRREEAEGLINEIAKHPNESARLTGELWVQLALGNLDRSFTILMRQAETHAWPFGVKLDPLFAQVRKDPRYPEFCKKVGIEP